MTMKEPACKQPARVASSRSVANRSFSAASRGNFPHVQFKLTIGRPNDIYEQEADRVADQVMRMPAPQIQRACSGCEDEQMRAKPLFQSITPLVQKQLEEEEPVQTKFYTGPGDMASPGIERDLNQSRGYGSSLPESVRNSMESRFGADFSGVRVHTDGNAVQLNRQLSAQAFTRGSDIYFNSGKYNPGSSQGKHLLAHELTHTIQQGHNIRPLIQCRCTLTPPSRFDLGQSGLGQAITNRLGRMRIRDPENEDETIPEIPPARVISILNLSPCFLHIASRIEGLYYGDNPSRGSSLRLVFHRNSATGSHFDRSGSRITIQMAPLGEVVRTIAHEVVHAWHSTPSVSSPNSSYGSVTRYEQAMVAEESRTRITENDIMQQIYAAGGLPRAALTPSTRDEVRDSFRSGRPRLTYQEYFIIEEMKRRTTIPETAEYDAVSAADTMIDTGVIGRIRPGERIDLTESYHSGILQRTLIPRVPTLDEAEQCVRIYYAYQGSRRYTREYADRLEEASPGGLEFIQGYYSRFGIDRQDPRGDRYQHRMYLSRILYQMEVDLQLQRAVRRSSQAFMDWLNGIPQDKKSEAIAYFEWIMIQQKMSAEWLATGSNTPDHQIRTTHLDFLIERIGRDLRGISVP